LSSYCKPPTFALRFDRMRHPKGNKTSLRRQKSGVEIAPLHLPEIGLGTGIAVGDNVTARGH
jgi:hypothetical protein